MHGGGRKGFREILSLSLSIMRLLPRGVARDLEAYGAWLLEGPLLASGYADGAFWLSHNFLIKSNIYILRSIWGPLPLVTGVVVVGGVAKQPPLCPCS